MPREAICSAEMFFGIVNGFTEAILITIEERKPPLFIQFGGKPGYWVTRVRPAAAGIAIESYPP
jgi:hypothetical protein